MADPKPSDVLVVGGGVIGLSVAWRARQRGMAVTVLERDTAGQGTSRVAAGMLAPVAEVEFGDAGRRLLELGLRSAALWPASRRSWPSAPASTSGCGGPARCCSPATTTRRRARAPARVPPLARPRRAPARAERRARARAGAGADAAAGARGARRPLRRPAPRARGAAGGLRGGRRACCARAGAVDRVEVEGGARRGRRAARRRAPARARPSCSPPARGAARSTGCRRRRGCRCARSRARSCACATRPGRGCSSGWCASRAATWCRAGDGRYVLGATVEERGLRAGRDRRRRLRAAARRPRAAARGRRAGDRGALGGSAPGHARQPARDRPGRGRGAAVGDRPPPQRHPARAAHRRAARRDRRRRRRGGSGRGSALPTPSCARRATRCAWRAAAEPAGAGRRCDGPAQRPALRAAGAGTPAAALAELGLEPGAAASRWRSTARSCRAPSGTRGRSRRARAWRCSRRCREDDLSMAESLATAASPPGSRTHCGSPAASCARGCCSARAASPRSSCWPRRSRRAAASS